jgi:hypothetical protein
VPTKTLTPEQLAVRAHNLKAALVGVPDGQQVELLKECVDAVVLRACSDGRRASRMDDKALLERKLRERVIEGDVSAMRILAQQVDIDEARQALSQAVINIVPYRVKDTSLREIVRHADERPVAEMLDGLLERLEADGAPEAMQRAVTKFKTEWEEWALEAYYRRAIDG